VRLNMSVGVVTWPDDGRTKAELLHRLDEIMYLAESSARDVEPADERQGMNSRAAPQKLKTLTPFRTALIAVLVVGLFGWFVWPTRYRYDHLKFGQMNLPVRIDRFSGRAEALYPSGWETLGHTTDTIPSGAPVGEPAPPTGPIHEGATNGTTTTPGTVTIIGPDNKTYLFPPGTTKDDAIRYFKRKGIGTATTSGTPSTQAESSSQQK
jgi:hypothetical protein